MNELKKEIREIAEYLKGWTKDDFEKIFNEAIIPIYYFQTRIGENIKPNYKIIDRKTGKEYKLKDGIKKAMDLLNLK